jgi:O-antigen/teichoic acid export membrane protein
MGIAGTIAKNTLFSIIATASELFINFVVSIVLARELGTEQYGVYALLMWFLTFAHLAANLGLGSMAVRFIAEALGRKNGEEVKGLTQLLLKIRLIAALIISLVILTLSGLWARLFAEPLEQTYFFLLAFVFLPNILNLTFISIFSGFQKYHYNAYLILGTNPLRAILVISMAFMGFGIEELLIANITAWVVGILIGTFLLNRLIPLKTLMSPSQLGVAAKKRALKFSLTIIGIMAISYLLYGEAVVLLLGLYYPAEEVGFYTIASKFPSMVMTLVPTAFATVLAPAIAEQFGKGDMEKLKTIYFTSARYLMVLAMPLAAGGVALASPIIHLLYGADYAPVIILMQILFVPFVIKPITHGAIATIQGINEPAFIFRVGLFLGCLNIGLSLWLIPLYGARGAAIATSAPLILTFPFYIHFIHKNIGVNWPFTDTIKIATSAVFMGLVLYFCQIHLGMILSLVICIPSGIALYAAAIIALKVIGEQDLIILKGIQNVLPINIRKSYIIIIAFIERLIGAKRTIENSNLAQTSK